jgi:hypothetical protein
LGSCELIRQLGERGEGQTPGLRPLLLVYPHPSSYWPPPCLPRPCSPLHPPGSLHPPWCPPHPPILPLPWTILTTLRLQTGFFSSCACGVGQKEPKPFEPGTGVGDIQFHCSDSDNSEYRFVFPVSLKYTHVTIYLFKKNTQRTSHHAHSGKK